MKRNAKRTKPEATSRRRQPRPMPSTEIPKSAPEPTPPSDEVATSARPPADAEAWAKVLANLRVLFPLTDNGSPSGALARSLRRIESGFSFVPQLPDEDFSELHVEPLLDQAADLLDRGVRERSVYDDLASRMLLLSLDIKEFSQLDLIHQEEEKHGYYEVPFKQSQAEWWAEVLNHFHQKYLADLLKQSYDDHYDSSKIKELIEAARRAAWIAGRAPSKDPAQKKPTHLGYAYPPNSANPEKTVSLHQREVADAETPHRLNVAADAHFLEVSVRNAMEQLAKTRADGLRARRDWDYANQWFGKWRTQVVRQIQDFKAAAAANPDGVLNYGKRLDSLRARFQQDFRNALARLKRLERGMWLLYGYDVPLPNDTLDINYFDNCLLWTRAAIDWLVRFARREQSFVLPVSVRRQVGEQAWSDGLAIRRWQFTLAREVFERLAHIRLRGLGAVVARSQGDGIGAKVHRIGVRVPTQGLSVHLSGHTENLAQGTIPPCQLARVTTRGARRDPDVFGVSALHNASPIGEWRVVLYDDALWSGVQDGDLEDVVLDLHLAYRTASDA